MSVIDLPELYRQTAFEDFNETPELRATQLSALRESISLLPQLEDQLKDTSDLNLIRFLRSKKFDHQRASEACTQWQKFNNKYGDILANVTREGEKIMFWCTYNENGLLTSNYHIYEEVLIFRDFIQVIRESGPRGRVIVIMRPGKGIKLFTSELKRNNPRAMLRLNFWIFETLSFDPQVQVNGLIVINSFKGLSIYDQMTLSNMAPLGDQLATFQHFQILGMRFKAAFIFEQPPFMTWLWFFIRPFMSEKITGRFFLCGQDYSMLSKAFTDTSILPADLLSSDGTNSSDPSSSSSNWMEEQFQFR